jgi:hypothetical protein
LCEILPITIKDQYLNIILCALTKAIIVKSGPFNHKYTLCYTDGCIWDGENVKCKCGDKRMSFGFGYTNDVYIVSE